MSLITRDFISENFVGIDITAGGQEFDKKTLIEKINFWKYVLKYKCNAVAGESLIIGNQTLDINYMATIFAAAELSLKLVIIDYIRSDKFKNINFIDPKTEVLSPIDIFLHDFPKEYLEKYPEDFAKFNFFKEHSKRTYSIIDDIDYTINQEQFEESSKIFPDPKDIIIRSTSSGTTTAPKVIEHTHEFIYEVSKRNSKLYKGVAVHVKNLNHGASAAVTLFPVVSSDLVTKHLIHAIDEEGPMDEFVNRLSKFKDEVEFLFFPYPYLADKFIEASKKQNLVWPNLQLVTLSSILESSRLAIRDGIFKSIISIFGSTETIGPVVANITDNSCWNKDPRYFKQIDDFYKIKLYKDGKIGITPPVYNKEVITNDHFKFENGYFIHQGRSDLLRINGETINLSTINDLNRKDKRIYIVVDSFNHCLYLACWENIPNDELSKIKQEIESQFERAKIAKLSVLEKENFYYGIKIDNELLREYFRHHID